MATKPKTLVKHILALLKMPRTIADKITHAQSISSKVAGNPNFPNPNPPLATLNADIQTLVTAESAAKAKTTGAVAARDVALGVVVRDLHSITLYVQSIADASPDRAAELIEGAGLAVKKSSPRVKADLSAKAGKDSGTVVLVARGAGGGSAHNWQMSKDQLVWVDLPTTISAKTEVTGLVYGATWYFRQRAVIRTGTQAWTNAVSYLVK